MFDYFKKIVISNRTNDEFLYEFVLNEMETGVIIKGLWGKALANSEGNDANAKSIYMKYRVQAIKDVFTSREIAYNELTKPKLFQYIQNKILPMSNDYINFESKTVEVETQNYKVSKDEEAIYNEVAEELSNDIRKEGFWLKAIQNTDGNESKALALYIKYRSEAIKAERQKVIEVQKLKKEKKEKRKKDIEEAKKAKIANELQVFLKENGLYIVNQISPLIVRANYCNSPIDVNLEYKSDQWQIVDHSDYLVKYRHR